MRKRYSYEEAYNYFQKYGCELLEKEYINYNTKMQFKCKCGNIDYMDFDHFKRTHKCKKCSIKIQTIKRTFTYEYVQQYFREHNCELLESEYINCKTKMKYKCECGNESCITFDEFRSGRRCNLCARERQAAKRRLDYNYVKNYFEQFGYQLLEKEYINAFTNIKCKCPNDHFIITTWNNFQRGKRCLQCLLEYRVGENHPKWNFNLTNEDRISRRLLPECQEWRNKIFKRDNYTCQICNQYGGEFRAHHLDGYHWCIEKRFDIDNGVTLCKNCHQEFHNHYGTTNNTKEQFNKFLLFKNNQTELKQETG